MWRPDQTLSLRLHPCAEDGENLIKLFEGCKAETTKETCEVRPSQPVHHPVHAFTICSCSAGKWTSTSVPQPSTRPRVGST
jgi:hypothetical protein